MKTKLTIIAIVCFCLLAIIAIDDKTTINDGSVYPPINSTESQPTPVITSIKATEPITSEELEEISDTSSEHNGRWAGLCPKNLVGSEDVSEQVDTFKNVVMSDPVLAQHFSGFMWSRAVSTTLGEITDNTTVNVTHRSGGIIKPSKKVMTLKKDESVITDGYRIVRTYCCNDVVVKELPPPKPAVPYTPPTYTYIPHTDPVPPVTEEYTQPNLTINTYYGGGHRTRHFDEPTPPPVAPVPAPTTLLLFGTGISALAWLKRKKNK